MTNKKWSTFFCFSVSLDCSFTIECRRKPGMGKGITMQRTPDRRYRACCSDASDHKATHALDGVPSAVFKAFSFTLRTCYTVHTSKYTSARYST